jgi:hypothetical protein
MTNWKSLQDSNPEPSLLDAIAHAEHGIILPVPDMSPDMSAMPTLKWATLDGKPVAYSSETTFLVQVGRYTKGKYTTRYIFKGNLPQACIHYRCINIGRGYKKRLVMVGANKPVLAKAAS